MLSDEQQLGFGKSGTETAFAFLGFLLTALEGCSKTLGFYVVSPAHRRYRWSVLLASPMLHSRTPGLTPNVAS